MKLQANYHLPNGPIKVRRRWGQCQIEIEYEIGALYLLAAPDDPCPKARPVSMIPGYLLTGACMSDLMSPHTAYIP
jgi:hypothetical protein